MKKLFFYVEGSSDEIFFEFIIKKLLDHKYDIRIIPIRGRRSNRQKKIKNQLVNVVKTAKKGHLELVIVIDSDSNNFGGWNSKIKEKRMKAFLKEIGIPDNDYFLRDHLHFVVVEIEGWYLAGLDKKARNKLKFKKSDLNTDKLTKEKFLAIVGRTWKKADYIELLNHFNHSIAKSNNKSC